MTLVKRWLLICSLFISLISAHAASLPPGFVETLIAQNLDPTDLILAPDGRIFITVKSGKILIIENGVLLPEPFLNIETQVDNFNERGLGHMIFDPGFESNHYYYVYYTVKGENFNRISRFTATGNFTEPGSEQVLMNLDLLDGTIHNAGAMVFGLDGKLYVSVGEGSNAGKSQLTNTVLGKVLRINSDGSIPTDNPFYTTNTGKNRAIYALGFRNPFTMSMDPVTGKIYVNDVGGGAFEEVNELQPGKNYGWPVIEGYRTGQTPPANYKDPVYAYPHGNGLGAGCAIVGSSFYNYTTFPAVSFPDEYHGRYFFADYCNGYIRMIDPATGALIAEPFATGINRPLAVRAAADGSMYYLARAGIGGGSMEDNTTTTNGTLWRVTYTGSGTPVVSVQPQNILVPIGEDATFEIRASGAEPFTYQWQVDDVDIPNSNSNEYVFVNAQLSDDGKKFRCVITNNVGQVTSNEGTLTVTSNTRPQPSITLTLPNNATTYRGGDLVMFSGTATDAEDGSIPPYELDWQIDFHHDSHTHPALSWTNGIASGAYTIPTVGETASNVWLRVYLRATDSEGLTNTVYKEIFPEKSDITLATDPAGLKLLLDGAEVTTPATFTGVVNLLRQLEAPSAQINGSNLYLFDQWTNGTTNRQLNVLVPENDQTYTASYIPVSLGDGTGLTGHYYSNQDKTFNEPATLIRDDETINFNWYNGAPPGISPDHFTVRWLGGIIAPITDTYTFHLTADDGIRLWVNNQKIIDKWIDQGATEWTGSINLGAGIHYPIQIEFYENGGDASIKLEWSSSKLTKQLVPSTQLLSQLVTGVDSETSRPIKLYPTLADDIIFVDLPTSMQSQHWTVINTLGQPVLNGTSTQSFSIKLEALSPGVYIFKFQNDAVRFVKR